VPWFAIVTDVALQLGETWLVAGSQSFTLVAVKVTPAAVVSFVKTVFT
jgi:hypothetical protein